MPPYFLGIKMTIKQNQSRIIFSLSTMLFAIMALILFTFSGVGLFKLAALWLWSFLGIIVISRRFNMTMLSKEVISYERAYAIALLIILWPLAFAIKTKSRTI